MDPSPSEAPAPAAAPYKRRRGNNKKPLPPRTERFDFPPATPEFFEEGGLRKVKPYMYTYDSFAKERWQGRTLIDMYGEFRGRSIEYHEWTIQSGAVVVNNAPATPSMILKNGDLISNVLHRHEPPVVAGPIRILYDGRLPGNDGETLVVEKPGSMPVHPTGRYTFNTLLEILKYDYDLPLVHTSNRLDRLTSGVMVCSLTVAGSKKLGAWFGGQRADEGGVEKEYVARCLGFFPDGEITVDEPLLTIDRQIGVNVVHPDGRNAKTIFRRQSYHAKSNTSVVHCRPITGRSHQIRVHLQHIGFPIGNDPVYQNERAWGPTGGKGGVFEMPSRDAPVDASTSASPHDDSGPAKVNKQGHLRGMYTVIAPASSTKVVEGEEERLPYEVPLTPAALAVLESLRAEKDEQDGWSRWRDTKGLEKARRADAAASGRGIEDEFTPIPLPTGGIARFDEEEPDEAFCPVCFSPEIPDPKPEELFIWLHALRYKTIEWDWKSEMPKWAEEDWEGGGM